LSEQSPLVLVSNRGPVTYQEDGSVKRGTGGLVTALTGLASHRDAIWIASAMTEQDMQVAREHEGKPFEVEAPEGGSFRVRFVDSDDEAYDRFYNIIANPMLWFISHYLWDLSNAPDIRRHEEVAFHEGYQRVNADLAEAVVDEIEGQDEPVVMVHDYHLYTLPQMVRAARPDVFLHHFIHIPWTQPDAWRVLPTDIRETIYHGVLANDIVGFHTRSYRRNFLQCCRDLMDLDVDFERGIVHCEDREVWVRAYPLPIDYEATRGVARRPRVREFEAEVLRRRREYSILRVDRADLSKNVLRGFTAFDIFLEQHPEFAERITFTAQLMPSRTDVPEYAEYLEKIEALVAVVNHRHGTPDWMPIDLKLRDDLDEAVASYKHYDVMMVNAMFDGMNLVAKEGPLVNERNGVSILSENTGAHEELGEFALSVNPFDVQELADAIYAALTMSPEARERRAQGLKAIVTSRDPGDWIDEQIDDIRAKAGAQAPSRPG
jgi:trehalose 6-phosphate synthase